MGTLTIAEMCDGVKTTICDPLVTAGSLKLAESFDELSEDYQDTPMAQVYANAGTTDAFSANDRTTFRAGIRTNETEIVVDLPACQRGHAAEDMAAVLNLAEAVDAQLVSVKTRPYFGLVGVKAFRWRWTRVVFARGASEYPGVRFQIWLIVN